MIIAEINKIQYEISLNQLLYLDYQKHWNQQSSIFVDRILVLNDKIGTPYVKDAKIQLEFLKHGKHKKIIVYKYKPKKNYHKKQGHRQKYTLVKVVAVFLNNKQLFTKNKKTNVANVNKNKQAIDDKKIISKPEVKVNKLETKEKITKPKLANLKLKNNKNTKLTKKDVSKKTIAKKVKPKKPIISKVKTTKKSSN